MSFATPAHPPNPPSTDDTRFAAFQARALAARTHLRCDEGYRYGNSPQETLDLFPAARANAPLLMLLHGEAWPGKAQPDLAFLAPTLVEAGIALALVRCGNRPEGSRYDLAETVRLLLRAPVWLWHNASDLGADPQRLFVGGHGAGAHLAAMLVAAQWSVYVAGLPDTLLRGALCLGGLYDLAAPTLPPDLGHVLSLDADQARQLSPISYRPRHPIPLIAAVGARDAPEFRRQNALLAPAWPHCPVQEVVVAGQDHLGSLGALADPYSELFRATRSLLGA